jgi:hypothetical protein
MLGAENFLCLGLHAGAAAGFFCLSLSTYPFGVRDCKRDEINQSIKMTWKLIPLTGVAGTDIVRHPFDHLRPHNVASQEFEGFI